MGILLTFAYCFHVKLCHEDKVKHELSDPIKAIHSK